MIRSKLATLLLAAIFASTSFITTASASEVNKSLAADPTATLSAIDAMHLTPLSDQTASEIRGEGFLANWVVSFLVKANSNFGIKGVEVALNGSASSAQLRATYPGIYGWVLSFFPWALSPQIAF